MGFTFERDLLFLIHDVARLMRVESDRRARRNGMTRAQWGILLRLAHTPGLNQKELADVLEVEPITVARLVDRLEASGLVERRPDAQDRRVWRLHLRPAAEPKLAEIAQQRAELGEFVTVALPPGTHDTMVDGLLLMKANLSAPGRMAGNDENRMAGSDENRTGGSDENRMAGGDEKSGEKLGESA